MTVYIVTNTIFFTRVLGLLFSLDPELGQSMNQMDDLTEKLSTNSEVLVHKYSDDDHKLIACLILADGQWTSLRL